MRWRIRVWILLNQCAHCPCAKEESKLKLCAVDEIPDGAARGFTVPGAAGLRAVLVARRADKVFAYENRCPHTGVNLDWTPDQFMDLDGAHLQCATHGALFRINDGHCVFGPCAGQALAGIPTQIRDGHVEICPLEGQRPVTRGQISP